MARYIIHSVNFNYNVFMLVNVDIIRVKYYLKQTKIKWFMKTKYILILHSVYDNL